MPGPGEHERRQRLLGAALAGRGDRVGADEARSPPCSTSRGPASIGLRSLVHVVAVEVEADLQPQRVAGAEAGRLGAGGEQRVPDRPRRARAPAGARPRPRPCSRSRRRAPRRRPTRQRRRAHPRRQLAVGELGDDRARLGPLHGEHRVVVDRVGDLGVEARPACSREPGEVALVVGGVGDRQVAVVGEPVGEQVVEDPAVVAAEDRVLGAADLELRRRRWRAAAAAAPRPPAPTVSISPMCETSKTPQPERTARCSARTPSYWTGISQPANGTSLRARGDVRLVQRGALERRGGHAGAG